MQIDVFDSRPPLGRAAAERAAAVLRSAIADRGSARLVTATGSSQFEMLDALVAAPGIRWPAVELFHLDEYLGLPSDHPASFRRFLRERLTDRVPVGTCHWLDGDRDPAEVIARVGREVTRAPVDLAFVGIGENGHLAFNDPPADFETVEPFLEVALDEACRRQQVGEGWFATMNEVPSRAITMSIRQILAAREILCLAPDARKARAVRDCFTGVVRPEAPASALRMHARTTVYLDTASAALLPAELVTTR
jgi:glucosamine-6-phosphate deaminase